MIKKVYLEITNICNLSCDFCPKTKRAPQFMSVPAFTHAITSIRHLTKHVYFHLMGEPLLHPDLAEFFAICHANGMQVNLTTNGTLIAQASHVLLQAPALRKVSFSLHSQDIGSAEYKDYIAEIERFTKEVAGRFIIEYRNWNAQDEGEDKKIAPNVYLSFANKFNWPDLSQSETHRDAFCYGLRDQFGILVDGTVVPCCLDYDGNIALGNLFKQPIDEILRSERARKLYEGFSNRTATEELCKKCGYAQRFQKNCIDI